jgi:hypothetical protein
MKRIAVSTLAAAILALAGTTVTAGQGLSSARDAKAAEKLTLLGCVERADQFTPSGVPSTIATTVDSQSFVLIKAEPGAPVASATAPSPVGTSGKVATGDAVKKMTSDIGKVYKLEGQRETLNTHVGHKVEVTGTLDPASSSARPPDPQNPSAATSPVLVVESVKVIAEMCPR